MSYEVKVLDEKVIKLLQYLEEMQLIQFVKKTPAKSKTTKTPKRQSFIGVISKQEGEELHRQLKEMRDEWERI